MEIKLSGSRGDGGKDKDKACSIVYSCFLNTSQTKHIKKSAAVIKCTKVLNLTECYRCAAVLACYDCGIWDVWGVCGQGEYEEGAFQK